MSVQNYLGRSSFLLWIALLLPAVAWFVQLTASYMLAAYACAEDQMWILHGISIAAFLLAGVGLWSGWRVWRVRRSQRDTSGRDTGYLAAGTLFLTLLFLIGILANELSNWLLEPCI